MRYRHNQYGEVTIVQMFDTFWMAATSEGIRSVYQSDLTPITEAEVIPLNPQDNPSVDNSLPTVPEVDNEPEDTRVNINDSSHSAIAKALPGIGRLTARRIKERQLNQSEGRYADFNHLKEVNADLIEEDDAWAQLEPLVKFED